MDAAAAAERCGVDLNTYTTLLELQHRDITPEDYDTLQLLDSANKPKTLSQSLLDAKFPVWTVPEGGGVPAPSSAAERRRVEHQPRASRSLDAALRAAAAEEDEEGGEGAAAVAGPSDAAAATAEADDLSATPGNDATAAAGAVDATTTGTLCEPCGSVHVGPCKKLPWDTDRVCSICLEKFLPGQLVRSLPCSHVFHQECIDSWLTQSSRACPEDNIPVLSEGEMAGLDEEEAEQQRQELSSGGASYHLDAYALGLGGSAEAVSDGYSDEFLYRLEEAYARAAAEQQQAL
jgi:hypothetical protein